MPAEVYRAYNAASENIPSATRSLSKWNDEEARNKNEVIALLQATAQTLRNQESTDEIF
jgi:hypothetical protein